MTEPRTAAGRRKCNHWPGQPRCEVCGLGTAGRALLDDEMFERFQLALGQSAETDEDDVRAAILAIEAEIRAAVIAEIRERVEGLETPSWYPDDDTVLAVLAILDELAP